MITKLWITMPAAVGGLPALGEAVRDALADLHTSRAALDAIELCVTEAVNDAIVRRGQQERPGRVEVQLEVKGDTLAIAIGDRGRPWTPDAATLSFDPEDRASWPEGGMGLYLIHQLMSQVHYQSDPTHNVIHMSCSLKAL